MSESPEIPEQALLRKFLPRSERNRIWVYGRGEKPVLTKIAETATVQETKTSYTLARDFNFPIRLRLSDSDLEIATSVLNRINGTQSDFQIDDQDRIAFIRYIGHLRFRSRAIHRMLYEKVSRFEQNSIKELCQEKNAFEKWFHNRFKAIGELPSDFSIDRIREAIQQGFWHPLFVEPLVQRSLSECSKTMVETARGYGIIVYETMEGGVPLVTSDNPVIRFSAEDPWRTQRLQDIFGLYASSYAYSISTRRNIQITNLTNPNKVIFRKVPPETAELFNHSTIIETDRNLYAKTKNQSIADLLYNSPNAFKIPPITDLEEIKSHQVDGLNIGDVMLVTGDHWQSKGLVALQKVVVSPSSRSSHVLFGLGDSTFVHAMPMGGVHMITLADAIRYSKSWSVIRSNLDLTQKKHNLLKAALYFLHQQYNWNFIGPEKDDSSFCSELVVKIFQRAQTEIFKDQKAEKIRPGHFDDFLKLGSWHNVTETYKNLAQATSSGLNAVASHELKMTQMHLNSLRLLRPLEDAQFIQFFERLSGSKLGDMPDLTKLDVHTFPRELSFWKRKR